MERTPWYYLSQVVNAYLVLICNNKGLPGQSTIFGIFWGLTLLVRLPVCLSVTRSVSQSVVWSVGIYV